MNFPILEITSRNQWREWLEANHADATSQWVATYKKSGGRPDLHVPYEVIRDEAICFGWIDSRIAKLDADRSLLMVSRRKPRSGWSKVNKERIEALMAQGWMAAPGLAAIEAAKQDGSWTKLDAVETLEVPPDLAAAFTPTGREKFDAFAPSSRRGILEWISAAKTEATRQKRIAETARLAELGIRANFPESKGR